MPLSFKGQTTCCQTLQGLKCQIYTHSILHLEALFYYNHAVIYNLTQNYIIGSKELTDTQAFA